MDLAGCTTPVFLSAETLRLWTTVRVSSDRGFLRLGPITSNTSHWRKMRVLQIGEFDGLWGIPNLEAYACRR